jgi:PAS domain S-box-containing protein
VVLWSLAGTVGDVVAPSDANVNATIFNTGIFLAGLCHLAGAILTLRPQRYFRTPPLWLVVGIALALAALWFVTHAALANWLPVFFIPGQGGTLVRYCVLISAIVMFVLSSSLLLASQREARTPFTSWYALAMLLLAVGLFGIMIQLSFGSVVNWLGRTAQWLGGLYLLLAAVAALRESDLPLLPSVDRSSRRRYQYGVGVAIVLAATAARFALLPALGMSSPFLTFYPAVILAALYGGLRAGLLTIVLSALIADCFWMEPARQFAIQSPTDLITILFFLLSSTMISFAITAMHKARARLVLHQDHLEESVKNRTAELEREIVERRRAEEELVKTKTLAENRAIELQAIMDAVPALVFVAHDPQGSHMTGNRVTHDLLGVPLLGNVSKSAPQEERPMTFRAMRDGQEIPADRLPVQQAAQGHEVRDYELDLVFSDGARRTIFGNATPLKGLDGGINGAVGVFIDITRRKETEEALRMSEHRERERAEELAALFEAVPMPVFIAHDPDCLHLTGNRLADEILRISHGNELSMSGPEEIKPRHFRTFKDGRELRLDELPAQRAARGAHVKDFEFNLVFDDGMVRHVLGYGTPLLDDQGRPRGTVAVLVDITERKAAEEAVQRTLQRFYTVLSAMYGGLLLVTDEGRVEFANQALCDYFDLDDSPEDLVGLTASDVFAKIGEAYLHPDEAVIRVREIVDRGQPIKGEQVAMRGGRELLRDFIPIRIGGQSYGRLWCHTDITERKAMERELQKARDDLEQRVIERTEQLAASAKEFRMLAEAMPQIVWITRADGWNIYFNQQWVDYTGLTLEESYGHGWNKPFHPDDRQRAWDAWQNAVTNNGTYSLECRLRAADGTYRWWLVRGVPVVNEEGETTKWFGTCTDIEEFKRVEIQLRQAQKMEALGTMSGGIAHDFNNILAAIIGFSELLEGHTPKGSRDARHLHRIMEAGIRGRELVRQMLAFARKAEHEKKPLPVSSIVKESAKLLRATTPSTINIKVNASNQALILGDPTQIQQVLMNLSTNATHAMREKGGNLDIELSDHTVLLSNGNPDGIAPGQYVKLIVRDTGTGIPADIMDKIFDPFFTTKKLGEGTGLGLSVVHGIVKQHDGYIIAESEPGKGSTFTVYFPQITGEHEAVALHDDEIPTGSERILFVDDEEALVEMGEDILAELGYEVTSRMNGREALALFRADPSRFDLVITDQTMPEMTGVDLAREILATRVDMPIVMCTGFSYVVDADKAKQAGIRAFAMKPLTKREIARTIRKVLDE